VAPKPRLSSDDEERMKWKAVLKGGAVLRIWILGMNI
jgi:hypothetical protein